MKELLKILEGIHPEYDFMESDDFLSDSILDSFDIVNLVSELEEKFKITIDGEDVIPENFKNVKNLEAFVQRYLNIS